MFRSKLSRKIGSWLASGALALSLGGPCLAGGHHGRHHSGGGHHSSGGFNFGGGHQSHHNQGGGNVLQNLFGGGQQNQNNHHSHHNNHHSQQPSHQNNHWFNNGRTNQHPSHRPYPETLKPPVQHRPQWPTQQPTQTGGYYYSEADETYLPVPVAQHPQPVPPAVVAQPQPPVLPLNVIPAIVNAATNPPEPFLPLPSEVVRPPRVVPPVIVAPVNPLPTRVTTTVTRPVAATTPPATTVRRNTLPTRHTVANPRANSGLPTPSIASLQLTSDLKGDVWKYGTAEVDDLRAELEGADLLRTDDEIHAFCADLLTQGADQALVEQLQDAMLAHDEITVANLSAQLGLNPVIADELLGQAHIASDLDTMDAMIQQGADVSDVAPIAERLRNDINAITAGYPPATLDGLMARVDAIENAAAVSSLLASSQPLDPAMDPLLPLGSDTLMVNWPDLADGQVMLMPGGVVAVGVGSDGEFAVTQGCVADALGYAVGSGEPLPEIDAVQFSDRAIVLVNSAENGAAVNYTLGSESFSLQPGESRTHAAISQEIKFDRGGEFGEARYTVENGTYRFTVGDQGWDLRKKTFEVTIDNSENPSEFYYTLNGEDVMVKSGERRTHTSLLPPIVRFDRGNGDEPAEKQLESGSYSIAVNPDDNLWDLFPSSSMAVVQADSPN